MTLAPPDDDNIINITPPNQNEVKIVINVVKMTDFQVLTQYIPIC